MHLALFLTSILGLTFLNAQDSSATHTALKPDHRMKQEWWKKRHEAANEKAAAKKHDVLFIGDSITQGWEGAGKGTWEKFYAQRNALNLGFSGDRTEHVIWRLQNGNLKNQENAKLAIIMIGTNNTGHNEQAPHETAEGIEKIISLVKEGCPKAKIILLGIFPRSVNPTDKPRLINEVINKRIAGLDDGENVHYLELDDAFLNDQRILTKEIMPDALHPREKGYQIWAQSMEPTLKKLGF